MAHLPCLTRLCAALRWLPALIALANMGFVPAGIMPRPDAAGGVAMVICSGEGPVTLRFDPATGAVTPDKPDPAKPGCDWAMTQFAGDLGTLPAVLAQPAFGMHRATPALAADLWRPAHDPRGLFARGPPAVI